MPPIVLSRFLYAHVLINTIILLHAYEFDLHCACGCPGLIICRAFHGHNADRMFLKCAKIALGVKYNTSNVMVYGECGTFPPSVTCDINVICFYNRLKNMSSNRLARLVLNELEYLHHNGFRTWVTDVLPLSQTYGVENFDMVPTRMTMYLATSPIILLLNLILPTLPPLC